MSDSRSQNVRTSVTQERVNLLAPQQPRWPKDKPIIELQGVWKRFGDRDVIQGLDLTIMPGITTVIAGESGSGKSVLLKMMNGLILPDQGEVYLFGQALTQVNEAQRTELRKRCTMVFQNYALIDSMTVRDNIAFPLTQNTSIPIVNIYGLVDELLELLELSGTGFLLPSSLSGGMKKRVALARAVISNPELVLFDEPTTGLDPIMIEFVDTLIAKTQKNYGISSVMISHDMASNQRLADHLAVLVDGQIADQGSFDAVKNSEVVSVRTFMDSAVTERMQRDMNAPHKPITHHEETRPELLHHYVAQLKKVHKSFGEREILKGISLSVSQNKILVIIGGSGSGKSVLVKHIIGLLQATSGEVEVLGHDITLGGRDKLREIQSQIGVLFQGAALFDSMSVKDNIAFPLIEGRRISSKKAQPLVIEIARKMSVDHLLDKWPDMISNGERKRVALARALITQPKIMIYDEPTTGQDPIMMRKVDDMIVEAAQMFEMTSIVISHDMGSTFRIADEIAMIYHGELLIHGTPDQVRLSLDPRVQSFIFAGDNEQTES
jgi:ABC-type transporter Mla maintaining outer membrane lipid asymmetry ATPase subunit MlaF